MYPIYANTVNNFPFTKSVRFIYFSKKRNIGTTLFNFDAHGLYYANLSA